MCVCVCVCVEKSVFFSHTSLCFVYVFLARARVNNCEYVRMFARLVLHVCLCVCALLVAAFVRLRIELTAFIFVSFFPFHFL